MADVEKLKKENHRRGRGRPPRNAYIHSAHIREELPYTDFHPDLDVAGRLEVYEAQQVVVSEMDQGFQSQDQINLTKPSYRLRQPDPWGKGPVDQTMAGAFYIQDGARDEEETYIREGAANNRPVSVDRVEYDMDEQDDLFLQEINQERKSRAADRITRELLEVTMTKIEHEWNFLESQIPKQRPDVANAEDSRCSICDDGECENSNAIVFCDGCNLAVHQDCYGVPYIPEGQWLCRKCHVSPKQKVPCVFCPNDGGAYKQTVTNRWAHLLCTIWIPEITVANPVYMEPVEGAERIPKSRWKLVCYICRQRMGACIQCTKNNCFTAFHVTCARRANLFVKARGSILDAFGRRALCDKHVSNEWRAEHDTDTALAEAQHFYASTLATRNWPDSQYVATTFPNDTPERTVPKVMLTLKRKSSNITRLSSGAPVMPRLLLDNTMELINKYPIRKRKEFVQQVCRYWTLKRELRRGAPLLKVKSRTLIGGAHKITQRQGETRLHLARTIRKDLDRLRNLFISIRQREEQKLDMALLQKQVIDTMYVPVTSLLRALLESAMSLDEENLFLDVPDFPEYNLVIHEPMAWRVMRKKTESEQYDSVSAFEKDFNMVIANATLYNPAESKFYKNAINIQSVMWAEIKKAKADERSLKFGRHGALDLEEFEPEGLSFSDVEVQAHSPDKPPDDDDEEDEDEEEEEEEVVVVPVRKRRAKPARKKGKRKR